MGFQFRKSFKIAPGVRLNVGKKSVGISAGVRGARISTNTRTGTRATVGIPGTGLSYSEKIGGKKRRAKTGANPGAQPRAPIGPQATYSRVVTGYVAGCGSCGAQQQLPAFSNPATVFTCVTCSSPFVLAPDVQAALLHPAPVPVAAPQAAPPKVVTQAGECVACGKLNLPAAQMCSYCGANLLPVGAQATTVPSWLSLAGWRRFFSS